MLFQCFSRKDFSIKMKRFFGIFLRFHVQKCFKKLKISQFELDSSYRSVHFLLLFSFLRFLKKKILGRWFTRSPGGRPWATYVMHSHFNQQIPIKCWKKPGNHALPMIVQLKVMEKTNVPSNKDYNLGPLGKKIKYYQEEAPFLC